MDFKFCPECGTKNNADTKFCTECGNRFPEETFPAAAEPDSTQATQDIPASESAVKEQIDPAPALQPVKKKKKTGLVIVIIILALLAA